MRYLSTKFGRIAEFRAILGAPTIAATPSLTARMSSQAGVGRLDITSTPTPGQNIFHENKEYTTIKEGLAHILIPASASKTPYTTPKGDNESQSVFYNPIQQFNRDLSVLAIKAYGEDAVARKAKFIDKKKNKSQKNKKRKREDEGSNGDISRKVGNGDDRTLGLKMSSWDGGMDAQVLEVKKENSDNALQGEVVMQDESEQAPQVSNTKLLSASANSESNGVETHEVDGEAIQQKENLPAKSPKVCFTILDALSATGLRALRYSHEIPFTTSVTANDLLPEATKSIKINVQHNKLEDKITAITGNAMSHMYSLTGESVKDERGRATGTSKKYDVIDLDPYGTAAPFLDGAVQAVRDDGGLLCVTCTDAGVWASNSYPEKCYSLYGGIPVKGLWSHEAGLRLILHAIATSAARYGLAIEPLLSLSIDFYARVFVRIHKSPADVKFLAGKTMTVYNCDTGCTAWTTQMVGRNKLAPNKNKNGYFWKHVFAQAPNAGEHCQHCGLKTHLAGPMWAGPLHDADFIKKILADLPNVSKDTYHTTTRIEGMLTLALEELLPLPEDENSPTASSKTGRYDPSEIDPVPFSFLPGVLAKVLHTTTPDENSLRGALKHLGYRVTRSHAKGGSIKTDAPWEVIWEVMRGWVKQKSPVKDSSIRPGTAAWNILGKGKAEEKTADELKPELSAEQEGGEGKAKDDEKSKKIEVVFDEKLGKEKQNRKIVRYPANPRENWGPMNRAKGKA